MSAAYFVYLVVEKLDTPARGSDAMTREPTQPAATIFAVVDRRRRLWTRDSGKSR